MFFKHNANQHISKTMSKAFGRWGATCCMPNVVRTMFKAGSAAGDVWFPKWWMWYICGKHTKNDGKSPFLMGKLTISMAIFNSYVKLPEGTSVGRNLLDFFFFGGGHLRQSNFCECSLCCRSTPSRPFWRNQCFTRWLALDAVKARKNMYHVNHAWLVTQNNLTKRC